jgi:hypothetical protein
MGMRYLGKKTLEILRPLNSVRCLFRFLMLMLALWTFDLFNRFSAFVSYITAPTLKLLSSNQGP